MPVTCNVACNGLSVAASLSLSLSLSLFLALSLSPCNGYTWVYYSWNPSANHHLLDLLHFIPFAILSLLSLLYFSPSVSFFLRGNQVMRVKVREREREKERKRERKNALAW